MYPLVFDGTRWPIMDHVDHDQPLQYVQSDLESTLSNMEPKKKVWNRITVFCFHYRLGLKV